MNLPNQLTLLRLALAPVFVVLIIAGPPIAHAAALLVFAAATVTDWLDGRIARARNLVTNFGKLFDPLADKILTAAAFVMLMEVPELQVPGWTVIAIIAREFVVTGVRSMAAGEGAVISANWLGKAKMVLQTGYIIVFLGGSVVVRLVRAGGSEAMDGAASLVLAQASWWGIVAVALFTVYTGVQFLWVNWAQLHLNAKG